MRARALLLMGITTALIIGVAVFPAEGSSIPTPGILTYTDIGASSQPTTSSVIVQTESGSAGQLTFTDYPPGTPMPLSASGCNGRVCIYTTGSGLSDTSWRTTATAYYNNGRLCPDVYFYTKPPSRTKYALFDVYINDGTNCHRAPSGGSTIWGYSTLSCTSSNPCKFVDQTKQCNAWEPNPPLSGFPCVTVHT
jgi:hypothetical protein